VSRDSGDSNRSGRGGNDGRSHRENGRRPSGSSRDRRGSQGSRGSKGGRDGDRRDGDRRGGRSSDRGDRADRRKPLNLQPGAPLPRWVREEITRSTPKDRRDAALSELVSGLEAFADERYRQAATALRKAKSLSPRAATVREILGLSAYNIEAWEEALRELRTFRRITGETMHMAVELDCLRALGRDGDIGKTFELFLELGGDRDAEDEARVVYASHLLDQGRIADAWRVIKPGRLVNRAPAAALRRWAVAARVAAASGDAEAAGKILSAIRREDSDLEWLPELERELGL
jgi:tetratricopeptide (TPR) repeat protein